MKAVIAAFNQEKALVGAFSVITNLRMDLFEALLEMESGGPDNITVYNMITRPAPVLGTMSDDVFNIRLNKYLRNQTYYQGNC